MSEEDNKDKNSDLSSIRSKLRTSKDVYQGEVWGKDSYSQTGSLLDNSSSSWSAVSNAVGGKISGQDTFLGNRIDFVGKNLEGGKFAKENLQNANFTVANLTGVDFSGANLRGVDFSGANLSDANLAGADLSGAILSGAVLARTNFTGAILKGVKLVEADLENAILLDIEIDEIGLEELQALIEYMAKYYPHKLNLTRLNLTLLDLSKVDLSKVSLRGVDFTGVNFTGVNIMELDLSECIITPEQIAQALGRVPSAEELKKLLAPKPKQGKNFQGVDMTDLFIGDKTIGVWDTTKNSISIETILKLGKKVFRKGAEKPPVKDEDALKHIKSEQELQVKSHNDDLRKAIEERKKKELDNRLAMKKELQNEVAKEAPVKEEKAEEATKKIDKSVNERIINIRDRGRD